MNLIFRKNYPSYIRQRRRRTGFWLIGLIALVLVLGWFGYRKLLQMRLDRGHSYLTEGDYDEAERAYQGVAGLPFSGGRGHDGLGALDLLRDEREAANAHFEIVLERRPGGSSEGTAAILDAFIERGLYDSGKVYGEFLEEWKSDREVARHALAFATISLGARDLEGARKYLDAVPASAKRGTRYRELEGMVAEIEKEGRVPVLFDRDDEPLLYFDLATRSHVFSSPRYFAGWQGEQGIEAMVASLDPVARQNRIYTTLDLELQKAATRAMQGYKGTMILLEPGSGDILAAFGSEGYPPFSTAFEPGSVIKVLTYGIFLEEGGDVSRYAPKRYLSSMMIGDRQFWDWTEQGRLETVAEGMAVSCNLMFAQMGLDLTWPGVRQGFTRIYDGDSKDGYWGEGSFGALISEPADDYDLGNLSIGLEHLETTSMGLAILPAGIASGGTMPVPRLFSRFDNLMGQTFREVRPESLGRLFSEATAQTLSEAMQQSLTDERGTARRAEVPFVAAAMKTGTSGERPFNSVMIGWFPVEKPKIAFALYLHNGGKCEYHGAGVAKRLQEAVRELAPEYLGN